MDRSNRLHWLAPLCLLAAALIAAPATPALAQVAVDGPINPASAKLAWRWIGVRPVGAPCPQQPGPGWLDTTLLFQSGGTAPLPPALENFCLFEVAPGNAPTIADLFTLKAYVASGQLTRIGTDVMAVSGLGSDLAQLTSPALEETFLHQAGPLATPFGSGGQNVRLAILDTMPTAVAQPWQLGVPGAANSPHGFTLLRLARDLLCTDNGGVCVADITSRLTMAYTCFDRLRNLGCRDTVRGGTIGTIAELAAAIYAEVDAWEAAGTTSRLVINLSLGWEARLFGGNEDDPGKMPPSVEAVYRALQDARCRGAIVLAATGNRLGGPNEDTGPLLPAQWEQRQAPGFEECVVATGQALDPMDFPPRDERDFRPLVDAVGGIRRGGDPIFNQREKAEPKLVAYGDHATVEVSEGAGEFTETLTGTSVATVVASAAVAAGWQYRDTLRPDELLTLLHEKANDTGRLASFCLGGDEQQSCLREIPVRGLRVCGAVKDVCADGSCVAPGCASLAPGDLSMIDLTEFPVQTNLQELSVEQEVTECAGSVSFNPSGNLPENPCPHLQFHGTGALSWLGPQPKSTPCPNCGVRYNEANRGGEGDQGTLYIDIDDVTSWDLSSATLQCGQRLYAFDLGDLSTGDKLAISGVDCAGENPVSLYFIDSDGNSTVDALLNLDQ